MHVINEIKKKNFALILPIILTNLANNYLFLNPDLSSQPYEYVLNLCGYPGQWRWRRMRRGNLWDKGKTLGEGKATTFPLPAINSNYYMISLITFPVYLLSSHCIIRKFCSLSFILFLLSALLVPILSVHFYQIDCLLFHLDKDSALLITLNGKTNEHLDMLNSGIIYRLLEEKWTTFARVIIKTMLSLSTLQAGNAYRTRHKRTVSLNQNSNCGKRHHFE